MNQVTLRCKQCGNTFSDRTESVTGHEVCPDCEDRNARTIAPEAPEAPGEEIPL